MRQRIRDGGTALAQGGDAFAQRLVDRFLPREPVPAVAAYMIATATTLGAPIAATLGGADGATMARTDLRSCASVGWLASEGLQTSAASGPCEVAPADKAATLLGRHRRQAALGRSAPETVSCRPLPSKCASAPDCACLLAFDGGDTCTAGGDDNCEVSVGAR